MVGFSVHSGHFVQVWIPSRSGPEKATYIEVLGRRLPTTDTGRVGWNYVSRELPRRRAKQIAKEYQRAGLDSRVLFKDNSHNEKVTDTFMTRNKK